MTYRCASRGGSGRIESTGGRYNQIYNVPVLEDCGRQSRVYFNSEADKGVLGVDCLWARSTYEGLELDRIACLTHEVNGTQVGAASANTDVSLEVGQ